MEQALNAAINILWGVNAHMRKDPDYIKSGSFIANSGIGAIITYDSRDFPQNAARGFYSALTYIMYKPSRGGNTNFQALDFDTRWFIPLSRTKSRTLAINYRSRYDFGQAPFTSMISLGTSTDLRGFRFGQFRYYYLNYLIIEYRHKFYRSGGRTSRLDLLYGQELAQSEMISEVHSLSVRFKVWVSDFVSKYSQGLIFESILDTFHHDMEIVPPHTSISSKHVNDAIPKSNLI